MTEEIEFFENKKTGKTYISPRIVHTNDDGSLTKPLRIASKVFDSDETHEFVKVGYDLALRVSPGRRQEIKAVFYEDDRGLQNIVIQRFTRLKGTPLKESFSFRGAEIPRLLQFLDNIGKYHFQNENAVNITDAELRKIVTAGQLSSLLVEDEEALATLMRSGITKSDVIALGYRKQQLERFRKLLQEPAFFQDECASSSKPGEAVWQQFFEQNKWIFGYGLTYLSLESLDDRQLEQIVVGSDVTGKGKRTDALMKTKGAIESLCFVEIKRHDTLLLQAAPPYRPASWSPSKDLSGGITQSLVTVERAVSRIRDRLEPTHEDGTPTGERLYSFHPRSILVIGSLDQFKTQTGINTDQYRSFELLRRHTTRPEIITFDELYERARFIVANEAERDIHEDE